MMSRATMLKSIFMMSMMGRQPYMAAPRPQPTMAFSDSGASITRSGPYFL